MAFREWLPVALSECHQPGQTDHVDLSPTPRSTVRRSKERAVTDRAALYAILDAGLICHLSMVVDDAPFVLPTGYGREGNTLYLHGSTGAASLRAASGGAVCVAVTHLDGIVYARSVFHHSVNYRSAVIHGVADVLTDDDAKLHGLAVLTEHLAPGSWSHAREPNARELAATSVLALDLAEASVKIRGGGPIDDEIDLDDDTRWAGVIPLRTSWGEPESATPAMPTPEHVTARAARPRP